MDTENEVEENQGKTPVIGDGQEILYMVYALGLSSMAAGGIVCKRKMTIKKINTPLVLL